MDRLCVQRMTLQSREFPGDIPGSVVVDLVLIDVDVVMDLEFEDDPSYITPQKICFSKAEYPIEQGDSVYSYVLLHNNMPVKELVPYDPAEEYPESWFPPMGSTPMFLQ